MFIRQLSELRHKLVPSRQFFDQECPLGALEEMVALQILNRGEELQTYLQAVYAANRQGANAHAIEKPKWLVEEASAAVTPKTQDSEAPSSTTSRSKRKPKESNLNTNPKE